VSEGDCIFRPVILSDRSIREELSAGRIVIDPLDETCIQPSSVDLHVDHYFRVFLNHTTRVIDVKEDQADLTDLVEVADGDGFILHPGEFVLGSTAERVELPDDLVARLEGKALAYNTAIPTPAGFTTMEMLEPGDQVFGPDGLPCNVIAATDVMLDRPCREVVFSDGTVIACDAAHEWVTIDKAARMHHRGTSRARTTLEIEQSLRVRTEWNHHVELAAPVHYSRKALPVDPYVLGAWLGDGTSTQANLTCADEEIVQEIRRRGVRVEKLPRPIVYRLGGAPRVRDALTGRYLANASLHSTLRHLGLLGDKHIPRDYFEGDIEQRTDLLQGLMDTDGYVDEFGRCEFVSVREHLADGVVRLAASLGLRPVKRKKTAWLNGVDCGPAYQVKFTPDRPVFRLSRKLARQKRSTARFHRHRAIVAVREIESVPVKCIEVDHPRAMYLAGLTYVPTHNSSLGRLGLLIHSTAGFVDAGWNGHLTLELSNVANLPITIYPGMKIGQISFLRMTTPADHAYGSKEMGSKYQGQRGPTPSRYFENFR